AGNYSLRLLELLPELDVTLIDLSQPMLERAVERVGQKTRGRVVSIQNDIRLADLGSGSCDLILASAVLHHLRTDDEWQSVFASFYKALRPGGSIWIFDLIESSIAPIQSLMWNRYGDYLKELKDESYRDAVFAYVDHEDTPRSLVYQLDLLRQVGFR